MPLETEVKYLDADHGQLRRRLLEVGATRLGRWFEANTVYDDASRSLKQSGTLLRLRERTGRHVLTLKRAAGAAASNRFKAYEESETDVADPGALHEILAGLGFAPALRYEKVREKWALLGCEVCLDTLPFGDFVEIEGGEQDIAACASALGLPGDKASTATYHELNRLARLAKGEPPEESFVFEAAAKARLLSACPADLFGEPPLDRGPGSA